MTRISASMLLFLLQMACLCFLTRRWFWHGLTLNTEVTSQERGCRSYQASQSLDLGLAEPSLQHSVGLSRSWRLARYKDRRNGLSSLLWEMTRSIYKWIHQSWFYLRVIDHIHVVCLTGLPAYIPWEYCDSVPVCSRQGWGIKPCVDRWILCPSHTDYILVEGWH